MSQSEAVSTVLISCDIKLLAWYGYYMITWLNLSKVKPNLILWYTLMAYMYQDHFDSPWIWSRPNYMYASPKCESWLRRLRELRPYWVKFFSLACGNCRDLTRVLTVLFRWKINFKKTSVTSHSEISNSCTTRSITCQVVTYGRLKNKRKFANFALKVVMVANEVVASKRFQIMWFDLQTFGILENWSLKRGGRN